MNQRLDSRWTEKCCVIKIKKSGLPFFQTSVINKEGDHLSQTLSCEPVFVRVHQVLKLKCLSRFFYKDNFFSPMDHTGIFQGDKGRIHGAPMMKEWFRLYHFHKLSRMDWPPQSPDLNPTGIL